MSVQINLPITIGTGWNGFGEQFANLIQSGADSAGIGGAYGKSVAWSNSIIKPMQPQTESQDKVNEHYAIDIENGANMNISLMPNLGMRESYTGEQTYVNGKEGETTDRYKEVFGNKDPSELTFWDKLGTGFDIDPALIFLNYFIPGVEGATNVHDPEMNKLDNPTPTELKQSIPGSFARTWYSVIYGKYSNKIKEAFSNKVEEKMESFTGE